MNHLKTLIACAALLAPVAALAQANTGSLAGWTHAGDVLAQAGALRMSSAYSDESPASGIAAAEVATLESQAGLAPYALDLSAIEYGTEGSAISQSFAVLAGQTLSFNWSFTTAETQFQDHAFVAINGQVMTLATRSQPGAGSQLFSYTFTQAGTASLTLGVIDTVDFLGVSTLAVSNLSLSPVPEPTTVALWALGLGGLVWKRRRAA